MKENVRPMKKFLWMTLVTLLVLSMAVLAASAAIKDGYELSVELTDVSSRDDIDGSRVVYSFTYDVALTAGGVEVDPDGEPITFLLPVPKTVTAGTDLRVSLNGQFLTTVTVETVDGRACVEITSAELGLFTFEEINEHTYSVVVTPPTCTEKGYTTYICSHCDDSYVGSYVNPNGHSYTDEVTKNATCTEKGSRTFTCGVCGDTYSEEIAASGHDYRAVVTPPTCLTNGYTTYICDCGHTYTDDVVEVSGHAYKGVVTTPTATQKGYTTYTCSGCGDSYVDDYVSAYGSTVVLAKFNGTGTVQNAVGARQYGMQFNIGDNVLSRLTIDKMATFADSVNSWTLKIWKWNGSYVNTVTGTVLYETKGFNHADSTDFIVEIPLEVRITGEVFVELYYDSGNTAFTAWVGSNPTSGYQCYLAGMSDLSGTPVQPMAASIVVVPVDGIADKEYTGSAPTDPDVIVLADKAGFSPQTGGGDFFGQRFDIGNDTLKQLVITKLATFADNVNTWEIKFWQWDTNHPITVSGTPIYTATGSNHTDSADFVLDIPDSITLTGEIYYEIYYRSGNTGFAGWNALGDHYDSLHTYVNGSEVNTHIASYIRVNFSDTPDETETDAPTGELNVKQEDLKEIMQNVFDGTISLKETVMFIDKNTTKDLLFPINSVISVTSYDGKTTYLEGRDYEIVNGQLKITANSTMPAITSAVYYNYDGSLISKDGKNLYWGESMMKQWQVSVTYTHADNWSGFEQETQYEVYKDFVQKLANGEDVTVMFYGDSITWGANSTFAEGVQPKQGAYAMLFTEALADLFGYTVKYVNTGLTCHSVQTVPTTEYVAGNRGTITYVNTAVGGWTSTDGVTYFDEHIKSQFNTYGCDLFVVAFGMNDSGMSASSTKSNVKSIIDKMYQLNSKASVMIVSTMTPHSGTNWDNNNIKGQETQLTALASTYQSSGKAVAVAQVNSVSVAVQTRKSFNDYAGNNVNHPNDWFYRVYAQTMLQTLIGYENMK